MNNFHQLAQLIKSLHVPDTMFPHFTTDSIIPPFIGGDPTIRTMMSPYRVTMEQFVEWFGSTPARLVILNGLLDFRQRLMEMGLSGFQWLSGSFVEDIETLQQRPPGDIDVVSVISRPPDFTEDETWSFLIGENGYLFDQEIVKEQFKCDAYWIDLNEPVEDTVDSTRYWIGLFSHQRETSLWKGMMAVELDLQQDTSARALLQSKSVSGTSSL